VCRVKGGAIRVMDENVGHTYLAVEARAKVETRDFVRIIVGARMTKHAIGDLDTSTRDGRPTR